MERNNGRTKKLWQRRGWKQRQEETERQACKMRMKAEEEEATQEPQKSVKNVARKQRVRRKNSSVLGSEE